MAHINETNNQTSHTKKDDMDDLSDQLVAFY
jgi:hypothetical protein